MNEYFKKHGLNVSTQDGETLNIKGLSSLPGDTQEDVLKYTRDNKAKILSELLNEKTNSINKENNMNELIVVTKNVIGTEEVNSVDARDLHEFLKSKQEFAHWIKNKVLENPFFEENQDYVLLDNSIKQTSSSGRGGHNRKDYILTIDTAKKVAMAEQTKRGNEVRDYFIEVEKKYKAIAPVQTLTPLQMISEIALAADAQNKKIASIEKDLSVLKEHHAKKAELQDMLPEVNAKSVRSKINQIVRSYARKNNMEYWMVWGELYKDFYYRNSVNVKERAKNKGVSAMDYLEQNGLLEDVFALCVELFS